MKAGNLYRILPILLGLLLWQTLAAWAAEKDETQLFQQGNEAYSRGDYQQAIDFYEKLTASSGYSPSVLYNLANSYAHSEKIGRAILNYQRALRLAPGDADIAGNLQLVSKESGLFAADSTTAEKFFQLFHLHHWALFFLFLLILLTIFQALPPRYRLTGKAGIGVRLVCLLLLLLCGIATAVRYRDFNPSVVIEADARLLISPFSSASSVGAIQEGRLVFPLKNHGTFTYIRDETKRHGWIATTSIKAVIPEAGR
jgi:tetratricopeptide (TPR) repeat protein